MKKRILPFYLFCLTAVVAAETVLAPQRAVAQAASPAMTIEKPHFEYIQGEVGKTYRVSTFKITTTNMTMPVGIEMRGTDRSQFQVTPAFISPGSHETEVTVSYKPTTSKLHKAMLVIDSEELPTQSATYSIQSIAFNPAQPPSVTVSPNSFSPFVCEAAKTTQQTVRVATSSMAENTKVTFAQNNGFRVSTSSIFRNSTQNVIVTFSPLKEGEYRDTLIISSYGLTTQRIPLVGTATASTAVVEKEGASLEDLSFDNPLIILDEKFNNAEKNKVLSIDRWTNAVLEGNRAWWGYSLTDENSGAEEYVAKVTPYDSKVEYGDETKCSMMLISPPLDHARSASKIMTFRLRGEYLQDYQTDYFGVYILTQDGGKVYSQEIGQIDLPKTADRKGDWNEYHVDLSGVSVSNDVFCIGFGFSSMRGTTNSATYYVDDVSYGRTDLPVITPGVKELSFTAKENINYVSDDITITTENTTEEVTLKVGGPNASKFKVSKAKLPNSGGKFSVSFKSDKVGVHEAYIKVSSRGAADKYIALVANNTRSTGIETVNTTHHSGASVTVYDLNGKKVLATDSTGVSDLKSKLLPGIYVVDGVEGRKKIVVENK